MLYAPGTILTATGPDGSSVTGAVDVGADGSLVLVVIGQTLVLTDTNGTTLRPRWASCTMTVVEPPRPAEPTLPYALAVAAHPKASKSVWIRMPTGAWRSVRDRALVAAWSELYGIEVKFAGIGDE